jgi:hypothetical protein
MRVVAEVSGVIVGVLLGALAEPAWAEDIYRWTDATGRVHYSNTPAAREEPVRVISTSRGQIPEAGAGAEAASESGSAAEPAGDASVRRRALERDFQASERRLGELDAELARLAALRTRFAAGTEATGGVATRAADARSEEELVLERERAALVERLAEIRAGYAKLEEEVVARHGSRPDWWSPLDGGR